MKVSELKSLVNSLPAELDDLVIVMAIDDEGNGYRQFEGLDPDSYTTEDPTGWQIESMMDKEDADAEGYDMEDLTQVVVAY